MAIVSHWFRTSAEAYDACQTDSGLRDGDILIVGPERVVGLVGTWPAAVTVEKGELHHFAETPEDIARWLEKGRIRPEQLAAAIREAESRGWPVLPALGRQGPKEAE